MDMLEVVVVLYALTSICVVYKLAYLIRQSAALSKPVVVVVRFIGVLAGTVLVYRIVEVTEGEFLVEPFDVVMQIVWCVMLYFIIMLVGHRKQVW